MNDKEQKTKYIKEQIKILPIEAQIAIIWLLENIDIVTQILQGKKFTKEKITVLTQKSLEKKDYIMLVMIMYKQIKDQE